MQAPSLCHLEGTNSPLAFNFHLSKWNPRNRCDGLSCHTRPTCMGTSVFWLSGVRVYLEGPPKTPTPLTFIFLFTKPTCSEPPLGLNWKLNLEINFFGFVQPLSHLIHREIWSYSVLRESGFGAAQAPCPERAEGTPGCQSHRCQHTSALSKFSSFLPSSCLVFLLLFSGGVSTFSQYRDTLSCTFWYNLVIHRHSLQTCDSGLSKLQITCVHTIDHVPAVLGCFCQKVTQAWNALIRPNNNNARTESGYSHQSGHTPSAVVFYSLQ